MEGGQGGARDRGRLPRADLGNGYFRNPIIRGPGADNHILKVGVDYYQIDGGGFPDQIIWHSRDLVNWRPLTRALSDPSGRAWASDLAYRSGKFYLYTTLMDPAKGNVGPLNVPQRSLLGTADRTTQDKGWDNIVLVADRPEGPWSKPIHLGIYGFFDPGHVVDQKGNRYLYFNKGYMVRLAPDGLSTVGEMKKVYDGWDYPDDWAVEYNASRRRNSPIMTAIIQPAVGTGAVRAARRPRIWRSPRDPDRSRGRGRIRRTIR